jgi:hypothetical protein
VFFIFVEYFGVTFFIIEFLISNILFSKLIIVNDYEVVLWQLQPRFKRKLMLSDVVTIFFMDGGRTQALTTIIFKNEKNEKLKSIFLLLYTFERKQMAKFFEQKGVEINGNGI